MMTVNYDGEEILDHSETKTQQDKCLPVTCPPPPPLLGCFCSLCSALLGRYPVALASLTSWVSITFQALRVSVQGPPAHTHTDTLPGLSDPRIVEEDSLPVGPS